MGRKKGLPFHLLHEFCPLCFEPQYGKFSEVEKDDPRIDKVQAFHAVRTRNGLRVLDLSKPADSHCGACASCHMKCLVCGVPVLYSDNDDFGMAVAYLKPSEFYDEENKRMSVLKKIAARNHVKLTSRWNTCARKSRSCSCWIPRAAPGCHLHPAIKRKIPEAAKARRRWGKMLDSDPENEPVMEPRPVVQKQAKPLKATQSNDIDLHQTTQEGESKKDWGSLLLRMKPDAPKNARKKTIRKQPVPPKKVYSDGTPSGSGDSHSVRKAWLPREEWLAKRKKEEEGEGGFDIRVHGYWLTRSRGLVYRCPDGRELPATGADSF